MNPSVKSRYQDLPLTTLSQEFFSLYNLDNPEKNSCYSSEKPVTKPAACVLMIQKAKSEGDGHNKTLP